MAKIRGYKKVYRKTQRKNVTKTKALIRRYKAKISKVNNRMKTLRERKQTLRREIRGVRQYRGSARKLKVLV